MRSLVVAVLFLAASLAHAVNPTFSVKDLAAPGVTGELKTADFDGDHNADLAALTSTGISVFFGDGTGNFTRVDLPVTAPSNLQIADFNGDGRPDLAVLSGTNSIQIFLQNGGHNFTPAALLMPSGLQPGGFAAADFSGDGKADLVLSVKADVVSILPGNGDGTFGTAVDVFTVTPPAAATDPTIWHLRGNYIAADFNGDGKVDFAFSAGWYSETFGGQDINVLLNQGSVKFTATVFSEGSFSNATAIDANGDGHADLGFGWEACHTPCGGGDVWTLSGGKMSLYATASWNSGVEAVPQSPAAADYNGDGIPGVAWSYATKSDYTDTTGGHQGVVIDIGPFTNQQPAEWMDINVGPQDGFNIDGLVTADFNLDKKPDLAVVSHTAGLIRVLLNTTGVVTTPPGDFTLTVVPSSTTVKTGQATNIAVSVTPTGGFSDTVALSCSGLPAGTNCSFNPATLTVNGTAASSSLTVTTGAPMARLRVSPGWLARAVPVLGAVLLGGIATRRRKLVVAAVVLSLIALAACGGSVRSSTSGTTNTGGTGSGGTNTGGSGTTTASSGGSTNTGTAPPTTGSSGSGGAATSTSGFNGAPGTGVYTLVVTATSSHGKAHAVNLTLTLQ